MFGNDAWACFSFTKARREPIPIGGFAMTVRRRRRGRPSGFTPERARAILGGISRGLSYKHSAQLAGISYMTFNRWRKDGARADAPAELRDFCDHLGQAEARNADTLLRAISMAGRRRDWRAAAWILERRFPDEWALRNDVQARQVQDGLEALGSEINGEELAASLIGIWGHNGTLAKHGFVKAPNVANESEKIETVANSIAPGARN